ncbi:hypothetical protein C8Q76DRAFT_793694 [Earliella scabrosa]|nr:hypothetical protein C8Q76DRAFT_793694 [Earliella scabrosa]
MSDGPDLSQVVAAYESLQLVTYFQTVSAGLLAYEYMITFDREVHLFWRQKITLASILFGINRYLPLAVTIINLPYSVPNISFLASLGYLSVVYDDVECAVTSQWSPSTTHMGSLIAADIVVVAITWNTTYRNSREIENLGQRTSLSAVLFREGEFMPPTPPTSADLRWNTVLRQNRLGLVYFWVLLFLNSLHLILTLMSAFTNKAAGQFASSVIFLVEPITALLVSRFLLTLQEANHATMHRESLSAVGSLQFNGAIGSIAASLPIPGLAAEIESLGYQDEVVDQSADTETTVGSASVG